jgi:hypothetical protein
MFLYNAKVSRLLLQSPSHLKPENNTITEKGKVEEDERNKSDI